MSAIPLRGVLACCPHGDTRCPCVDGGLCLYEGVDEIGVERSRDCPMPPGELPHRYSLEGNSYFSFAHCHVEGCEWDDKLCGLAKLNVPHALDPSPLDVRFACGANRASERMFRDHPEILQ